MLPDFLIIGAQKAGTNALRLNLNKHPDIHVVTDELHFFNNEKNGLRELIGTVISLTSQIKFREKKHLITYLF